MQHQVTIMETGERYSCNEQESLLIAMARSGRRGIPLGCRGGGCGVCKVQIVDGEVSTGAMSRNHVSAQDEKDRCLLACKVFPRGDVEVKVLGKIHKGLCTSAGLRTAAC